MRLPATKWSALLLAVACGGGVAGGTLGATRASVASPSASPASLAAAAMAAGQSGPSFLPNAWFLPDDDLLGFVEIPAGPFTMGSDFRRDRLAYGNVRWSADRAQGRVVLDAYFIGRYEVTVAQFRAFVDASEFGAHPAALQAPPNHPVTSISWPDALAYAAWLKVRLAEWPQTPASLARALSDGWRVGLPSEAEWEKAARGTDGRIFPWGDVPRSDRANYRRAATTPVGSFPCPECPFGLLDMSGNVWELTRSPYQDYPYGEADDLADLDVDALWVRRGGHFADNEEDVRAAVRGGVAPGARRPFIGFRLVISRF